jgi:hypothetical protein
MDEQSQQAPDPTTKDQQALEQPAAKQPSDPTMKDEQTEVDRDPRVYRSPHGSGASAE